VDLNHIKLLTIVDCTDKQICCNISIFITKVLHMFWLLFLLRHVVLCVLCCSMSLFLYGPFCLVDLKLDQSTLFTTFLLIISSIYIICKRLENCSQRQHSHLKTWVFGRTLFINTWSVTTKWDKNNRWKLWRHITTSESTRIMTSYYNVTFCFHL